MMPTPSAPPTAQFGQIGSGSGERKQGRILDSWPRWRSRDHAPQVGRARSPRMSRKELSSTLQVPVENVVHWYGHPSFPSPPNFARKPHTEMSSM
jgi:hypothetical protein